MEKLFETKNCNMEIKAIDDNEMKFEGYASMFGNMDSYRDIVSKGCFARTLNNNKRRIKILWQHNSFEPIGKPTKLEEDEKGLYIEGKLCGTEKGKEVYTLLKEKVIDEMSIGYNTLKYEYDKENNIRYLKEVKLFEISLVTWGANEKARVNGVKFEDLLNEIKSGNLLKNASEDKILEAIKALSALIEVKDSDDTTQTKNNSPIKNYDSYLIDSLLKELKK